MGNPGLVHYNAMPDRIAKMKMTIDQKRLRAKLPKVDKRLPVVVHVHDGFDEYIGRAAMRANVPRCWHRSIWANPFREGGDISRQGTIDLYESLMRERLARSPRFWTRQLRALRGKRLGCWCKPLPCHGDVLVKLFKEFCL